MVAMRLVDMVLTFPAILRLVTIVSARWPSIRTVMLVIGLLGWLPVALVRAGRFITLRGQLADDLSRHPANPLALVIMATLTRRPCRPGEEPRVVRAPRQPFSTPR